MAYDGAGDVNVFLPPRVGFAGEPPTSHPHPPTSLLTFADMVIALDSRGTNNIQSLDNTQLESKSKTDHTYASVANSRIMTRSQSLKTTHCPTSSSVELDVTAVNAEEYMLDKDFSSLKARSRDHDKASINLDSCQSETGLISDDDQVIPHRRHRNKGKGRQRSQNKNEHLCCQLEVSEEDNEKTIKRSSSFENVQNQTDLDIAECSSEWPQISKKYAPRKSCSFEEVNHEINSQKRVVHRGGSSGQLHRLVNDTLEFPCWPRKADHTYATATWDGTAASHSLFDQEMSQETEATATFTETPGHQNMEVTETYYLPVRTSHLESFSRQSNPTLLVQSLLDSGKCNQANQKDDHTYVKSTLNSASCPPTSAEGISPPNFSFATFPRQKTRDDHTYFHSGMIRRGSGVTGGKEWASSHSVTTDLPMKKEHASETSSYNNADFLQSVSTKKDHNYSTSS